MSRAIVSPFCDVTDKRLIGGGFSGMSSPPARARRFQGAADALSAGAVSLCSTLTPPLFALASGLAHWENVAVETASAIMTMMMKNSFARLLPSSFMPASTPRKSSAVAVEQCLCQQAKRCCHAQQCAAYVLSCKEVRSLTRELRRVGANCMKRALSLFGTPSGETRRAAASRNDSFSVATCAAWSFRGCLSHG